MEEPGRFQLGGDLLDGALNVGGLPCTRADELATPEQEDDDLGLVDPVDEARELLRLVLDLSSAEGNGNRVQVDLRGEVRRRDDVLDHDLRILVHRDAGGPDLLCDDVDRSLDMVEALRARAHNLPASEQEDGGLRILETIDQPGELLRLVLGPAEEAGDRLKVYLLTEGGRGNDSLNLEIRRWNTNDGRSVVTAPASTRLR